MGKVSQNNTSEICNSSGTTNSELCGAILTGAAGEKTLFQAYCSTLVTLDGVIR
ncbi:MAG: hypothetical protein RSA64_06265 [Christensenellaceae bacterium]